MVDLPNYQFTRQGYEDLKKELEELTRERPGVLTRMVAAREQGDLSENAGYHAAKDRLGQIDSRIRELKLLLRIGKIVEAEGQDVVGFGSRIIVDDGDEQKEFTIVSAMEADPMLGKVSDSSPIGGALIGKKVGESVEIEVPSGKIRYKILEIKV